MQNSDVNLYQKMYGVMESNGDSVMVSDNKQGVDRVKKERNRYAFFMESSSIEYEVQRNCDLTEVGYWLDNKAYGIAMPFSWVLNRIWTIDIKICNYRDARCRCSTQDGCEHGGAKAVRIRKAYAAKKQMVVCESRKKV